MHMVARHVSELLGPSENGDAGPKGLGWELTGPDWGQRTTHFESKECQRNSLAFGLIPGVMQKEDYFVPSGRKLCDHNRQEERREHSHSVIYMEIFYLHTSFYFYWNLCIIKKQRYHFADKGPYNQSYGFSSSFVRIWELDHKEGWVLKTDALELWRWRRLLRVPWSAKRSNQSKLKEMSPKYSLEGLMLKLLYFGHLMQRADSLVKPLMLGKIEAGGGDSRGRDGWMASLTQWTCIWANSGR